MGGSKDGGEARDTGGSKYPRSPARAWMEPAGHGAPAPRPRSPPLAAETRCAMRSWGLWPAGCGHRVRPRGGERPGAARRCGDLRLSRAPPARLLEAQKSSISGSRVSPEAGPRPLPSLSTPGAFSSGPRRGGTHSRARAYTLVCTQRRTHPWTQKRRPGRNAAPDFSPRGGGALATLSILVWLVAICESGSHHWLVTCRTKALCATGSGTEARGRPACPRGCDSEGAGDVLPASGTRVGGDQVAVGRRVVAGGGLWGGGRGEANRTARAKAVMRRFARLAGGLGDFTARLWSPPGPFQGYGDRVGEGPAVPAMSSLPISTGMRMRGCYLRPRSA